MLSTWVYSSVVRAAGCRSAGDEAVRVVFLRNALDSVFQRLFLPHGACKSQSAGVTYVGFDFFHSQGRQARPRSDHEPGLTTPSSLRGPDEDARPSLTAERLELGVSAQRHTRRNPRCGSMPRPTSCLKQGLTIEVAPAHKIRPQNMVSFVARS